MQMNPHTYLNEGQCTWWYKHIKIYVCNLCMCAFVVELIYFRYNDRKQVHPGSSKTLPWNSKLWHLWRPARCMLLPLCVLRAWNWQSPCLLDWWQWARLSQWRRVYHLSDEKIILTFHGLLVVENRDPYIIMFCFNPEISLGSTTTYITQPTSFFFHPHLEDGNPCSLVALAVMTNIFPTKTTE